MNTNIPPFHIGQEVEAIESHAQAAFNKGDRFIILAITKGCCEWEVHIGMYRSSLDKTCTICAKTFKSWQPEWFFRASRFKAITPAFETISYTKILEEIPMGVN